MGARDETPTAAPRSVDEELINLSPEKFQTQLGWQHVDKAKRGPYLGKGVLSELSKKSDYEGFKRFISVSAVMGLTFYGLHLLKVLPLLQAGLQNPHIISEYATTEPLNVIAFLVLYTFLVFQYGCWMEGFHEFMHRTAFKTWFLNDVCLFIVGAMLFDVGPHVRPIHRLHHNFTNDIRRDPEMTLNYDRDRLDRPGFRRTQLTRLDYLQQFFAFKLVVLGQCASIYNCLVKIPVDYSGTDWKLEMPRFHPEIVASQICAALQTALYVAIFLVFGRTKEGILAIFFWWIVPAVLGLSIVFSYFISAEHSMSGPGKDDPVARTATSNFVVRFFFWDGNYHVEHHYYPMVPFFNLHKVHAILREKDPLTQSEKCRNYADIHWEALKPNGGVESQHAVELGKQ